MRTPVTYGAHYLRISKATVTSILHHGSPIYLLSCPSTTQKLECNMNAALRIATELLRWTPIPILRREANSLSITSSQDLQRSCYLLRHLSLGPQSPIYSPVHSGNADNSVLVAHLRDNLARLQVSASDIVA